MKTTSTNRYKKPVAETGDLLASLAERIVGQTDSIESIVPYVQMYQAGLAPEGRPVGVFLLLGPTGTGKTRTVEALADALHGNEKSMLRIDCGEFQMEHEVAKLIGAPPGYLGHRETTPMLTQQKLNSVTSERSNLSVVLFDEIEKAAASMQRLLLGVLDKAVLKLGDNTQVNFERSLIFLTSNLGARGMTKELRPDFGFDAMVERPRQKVNRKLESIAVAAVKKRFSPEFVNRIDVVNTYYPLDQKALERILEQQLEQFQAHVFNRLGPRGFFIDLTDTAKDFLLEHGTSQEYGARELKRTILRFVIQPLASLAARGYLDPGCVAIVDHEKGDEKLSIRSEAGSERIAA